MTNIDSRKWFGSDSAFTREVDFMETRLRGICMFMIPGLASLVENAPYVA